MNMRFPIHLFQILGMIVIFSSSSCMQSTGGKANTATVKAPATQEQLPQSRLTPEQKAIRKLNDELEEDIHFLLIEIDHDKESVTKRRQLKLPGSHQQYVENRLRDQFHTQERIDRLKQIKAALELYKQDIQTEKELYDSALLVDFFEDLNTHSPSSTNMPHKP
jgi:hypothetical protein